MGLKQTQNISLAPRHPCKKSITKKVSELGLFTVFYLFAFQQIKKKKPLLKKILKLSNFSFYSSPRKAKRRPQTRLQPQTNRARLRPPPPAARPNPRVDHPGPKSQNRRHPAALGRHARRALPPPPAHHRL